MQTWVEITKWEKAKRTLIDWERLSIQEQSSQPLIQSRLMQKYGEKAQEKSPNAVFLNTKTNICNRPLRNWLSHVNNWGRTDVTKRTGTRASQGSCAVEVHGCSQLLASRHDRAHPAIDRAPVAATSFDSFGPRGFVKPSFLLEFQYQTSPFRQNW